MTMLLRPCPGKLPVSRTAALLACATALLATFPAVSVAHAEETSPQANEVTSARAELEGTLAGMTSASQRVREMLRTARKRGTKPQVTCLDEALSRADVARRSARVEASEALAAYARSELESARAARVRVAELAGIQRIAVRDGGKCLPQPVAPRIVPGTSVRVTVDPSIPDVPLSAP